MSQHIDDVPNYEDTNKNTGLASLSHILGLFTGVLGPLLMYIFTDDEFVKENAKNALIWQLFVIIYSVITLISFLFFFGLILLPILFFVAIAFPIIAAIKASQGETWYYPGTVQLFDHSDKVGNNNKKERRNKKSHGWHESEFRPKAETEEELKQMYLDGKISDKEFEDRLDELQRDNQLETETNE